MELEVGIKDAKARLSKLVNAAQKGRRVYLLNRGKRVAEIVPVAEKSPTRGHGMLKGLIKLPPGWGTQEQRERDSHEITELFEGQ